MAGRCATAFQFQHGHHAHWKQEVVLVFNCHAGIAQSVYTRQQQGLSVCRKWNRSLPCHLDFHYQSHRKRYSDMFVQCSRHLCFGMYTWLTAGSMLLPGLGTEAWLMFEKLGSTLKRNILCPVPPERVSCHRLRTAAWGCGGMCNTCLNLKQGLNFTHIVLCMIHIIKHNFPKLCELIIRCYNDVLL